MSFLRRTLSRSRARLSDALGRLLPGRGVSAEDLEVLEESLIGADVGPETTDALLQHLRLDPGEDPGATLASAMVDILRQAQQRQPAPLASVTRPEVWLVVGVNGSGKTTTCAKLARWLQDHDQTVILGAADTFRAAAVEQLRAWAERLDVPVIAHQPGGDPAAVVFDTCQAASARAVDVAIIDTAGRLHTKGNLMAEVDKIRRVAGKVVEGAPHQVLLVLDGTTGQNGLRQAEEFLLHSGVTGLVLAKLDGTAKGGIALTIARQLGLPIRFVGTGEQLGDLGEFEPVDYVEALIGVGEGA